MTTQILFSPLLYLPTWCEGHIKLQKNIAMWFLLKKRNWKTLVLKGQVYLATQCKLVIHQKETMLSSELGLWNLTMIPTLTVPHI